MSGRSRARGDQSMRFVSVKGLAALAAGLVLGCGGALAASAEKGKIAFVQHGCWQCHGFQGQGGVAGPKLAPEPMPLETLSAFVRTTNRAMPPYREAILLERGPRRHPRLSGVDPEGAGSQEHSAAQSVERRAGRSIGPAWCRADVFRERTSYGSCSGSSSGPHPESTRSRGMCASYSRDRAPGARFCSPRSRS